MLLFAMKNTIVFFLAPECQIAVQRHKFYAALEPYVYASDAIVKGRDNLQNSWLMQVTFQRLDFYKVEGPNGANCDSGESCASGRASGRIAPVEGQKFQRFS
ncbi:hypothetical protein AVEN_217808-1 [Araneus ventricosus]|uniref:Uncharacterized protein n=1 Tax=Araneus ventricosus TaxID=182803 RepID=A0A4Y2VVX2_ARAVE|nr:hypothetical protein AVEN_217808-1 [Araneus ventricosus]